MDTSPLTESTIPTQLTLPNLSDSYAKQQEHREKINAWKKKSWMEFCKMVMDTDKRYSLLPMTDYDNAMKHEGMPMRMNKANGVFSNFCLRREGSLQDVYIVPHEPNLGLMVNAGSKYINMIMTGFPSKSLVWPVIRIADDMERQFVREVTIEANKRNTQVISKPKVRGRNAKSTRSATKHNDSDKLSTSEESNG